MPVDSQGDSVEKRDSVRPRDGVAAALLDHYDRHARDLAWRIGPAERAAGLRPDPYRVWLSEIMLQQTTVAAVTRYFEAFTTRWPTVADLAAAPEADVLAAWAGLGYYARARNLIRCARIVAGELGGEFPDSEAGLRDLPGIGAYTAAAIAAIAFDRRAVVVDANVERVVARLFAIEAPLPGARPAIRAATDTITPAERSGDFAQAMMDLGATICTVKAPACLACPVSAQCRALAEARPEAFPVKAPKKAKPARRGTAFWIERDGRVWLTTRPGSGMLGGMRALPDNGWHAGADGDAPPPLAGPWDRLNDPVAHVFTHFSLELALALYRGEDFDMVPGTGTWWPVADLDQAGLPTLFAKAARRILRHKNRN